MRFKGTGHKAMADALNSGAKGVEIIISGKIPSARARSWRFYQGYIKKCGNAATELVDTAYEIAKLKSGIVGIKVSIMPPNVRLPDHVEMVPAAVEESEDLDTQVMEKAQEAEKVKLDEPEEELSEAVEEIKTKLRAEKKPKKESAKKQGAEK